MSGLNRIYRAVVAKPSRQLLNVITSGNRLNAPFISQTLAPTAPTLPTIPKTLLKSGGGRKGRRGGTILTSGRGVINGVTQGKTLLG